MWGRKKRLERTVTAEIAVAQEAQANADAIIAKVESQDAEVAFRVDRLETRQRKNNFGEALEKAMMKRARAATQ